MVVRQCQNEKMTKGEKDEMRKQQAKLMWTPEALSLFMINHPCLHSLNDVEIYDALKNYSLL